MVTATEKENATIADIIFMLNDAKEERKWIEVDFGIQVN